MKMRFYQYKSYTGMDEWNDTFAIVNEDTCEITEFNPHRKKAEEYHPCDYDEEYDGELSLEELIERYEEEYERSIKFEIDVA